MLSPGVKAALADCEIGHRDTRFSQLVTRVRCNSRHVFRSGDEHSILFIGGPATAAIEAVCASLVPPDARVLVPVNGSFGARIAEILNVYQIPHTATATKVARTHAPAYIHSSVVTSRFFLNGSDAPKASKVNVMVETSVAGQRSNAATATVLID